MGSCPHSRLTRRFTRQHALLLSLAPSLASTRDNRCSCIAIALYFVDPYKDASGVSAIKTIPLLRESLDRERMNPFASYYIGWFDYSWFGSVALDDAPEFIDPVCLAERAIFQRDILRFKPTGYDLLVCDVRDSPTGHFRFSRAIHLSVSQFLELLPDLIGPAGEESPIAGLRTSDAGLLMGGESVVQPFADYLTRHSNKSAGYSLPAAHDYDLIPGDYGHVEY